MKLPEKTSLETMIKKEMEIQRINSLELAKRINVAPSTLSKFFSDKIELGFCSMLAIVRELLPKNESELMEIYSQLCKKPENIRLCMEYAAMNHKTDVFRSLIEKGKSSKNAQTIELAGIYEYNLRIFEGEGLPGTFPSSYTYYKITFDESRILLNSIFCFYMIENGQYDFLLAMLTDLEKRIEKMPDGFLKNSFKARLWWLFSSYYLNNFEVEKCRKYTEEIFSFSFVGRGMIAMAYQNLGMSFLYEDVNWAILLLNKSLEIYKKNNVKPKIQELEENIIPFIKNHYALCEKETEFASQEERAHYLVKAGKKEMALRILNSLEENPYANYLKGLCYSGEKGIEYLYKSMISFERIKNRLFSQMPRNELLKRGQSWAEY